MIGNQSIPGEGTNLMNSLLQGLSLGNITSGKLIRKCKGECIKKNLLAE